MFGEIVSLQFGHFSNHIGAHLWNGIENTFVYNASEPSEVNHDVLYRVGTTGKGLETYTPRLLLADLRNSLGSISETGDLYEEDDESKQCKPLWGDSVEVIKEPEVQQNEYMKDIETIGIKTNDKKTYNLDSLVNTWTDYLYTRFHIRTINIIKQYQYGDTEKKFDTLTNGQQLWKTNQFEEDYCDKIRRYVEECDYLQGFHVTLDSTDGFSGLGTSCIETIKDEYSENILVFPVISSGLPTDPLDVSTRVANLALCYKHLIENSSLFIPLSLAHASNWRLANTYRKLPYINYKNDSLYQTSAILSNFIDAITLSYRLKSNKGYGLKGFCSDLSGLGRKMAAASIGLPFGITENTFFIDHLNNIEGPLFTSLTPNCDIGTDKIMQVFTLRGINESILKKPLRDAGKQIQMEAYKYDTVKDMMEFYFSCNSYATASNVTVTSSPFKLPSSYPQFFTESINKNGFVSTVPREENENVTEIPMIAGVHNTLSVFDSLGGLIREAERIKINKIHRFKEAGLEPDEYAESLCILKEFQENYEGNVFL